MIPHDKMGADALQCPGAKLDMRILLDGMHC